MSSSVVYSVYTATYKCSYFLTHQLKYVRSQWFIASAHWQFCTTRRLSNIDNVNLQFVVTSCDADLEARLPSLLNHLTPTAATLVQLYSYKASCTRPG